MAWYLVKHRDKFNFYFGTSIMFLQALQLPPKHALLKQMLVLLQVLVVLVSLRNVTLKISDCVLKRFSHFTYVNFKTSPTHPCHNFVC